MQVFFWLGEWFTTEKSKLYRGRERRERERESRGKSQKVKIINACPTLIPQDFLSIPHTL